MHHKLHASKKRVDVHPMSGRQIGQATSDQPRAHLDHFGRPEGFTSSQSLVADFATHNAAKHHHAQGTAALHKRHHVRSLALAAVVLMVAVVIAHSM